MINTDNVVPDLLVTTTIKTNIASDRVIIQPHRES